MQVNPERLMLKSAMDACETCLDNWIDSKVDFVAESGDDFYIEGWNDGTKAYLRVYRKTGTFTRVEGLTVKRGDNVIYGPYDSPVGSGAQSEIIIPAVTLNTPWEKCDELTIGLTAKGVGSGGGKVVVGAVYKLREVATITTIAAVPNPVCTGEEVTVTGTVTSGEMITGGTIKLMEGSTVVASAPATAGKVEFKYTPESAGTRTFKAVYDRVSGYCASESAPVEVVAEDCNECDESFSYEINDDGTVTFTYKPAVDMEDVNVVFTFPQVEFITFLSGYEYESFERPGQGYAQNMQATLSFEACEAYTWTVQLLDCTAANPVANGWTDFKVDGDSKKNDLTPNFTYSCPE